MSLTISMLARRPRNASGIVWFHIVIRKMPLMASAVPASPRHASAGHTVWQKPNPMIATPQAAAASITARPCR